MPPCIVTAAGASSRMGGTHKLLLPWPPGPSVPPGQGGQPARTVVEAAVAAPLEAGCRVILVLGNRADDIAARFAGPPQPGSPPLIIVRNPDWARGMLGSIQRGLSVLMEAWPDADSWFSHHADMPLVTATSFRVMASARRPGVPLLAAFQGRTGKPALVPFTLNRAILDLHPDGQLKPFLLAHGALPLETNDPGVLADIDTHEEYVRHANF